ncbi:hypothetical protein [Streptomyces sp. NPDC016845]
MTRIPEAARGTATRPAPGELAEMAHVARIPEAARGTAWPAAHDPYPA